MQQGHNYERDFWELSLELDNHYFHCYYYQKFRLRSQILKTNFDPKETVCFAKIAVWFRFLMAEGMDLSLPALFFPNYGNFYSNT